MATTRKVGRPKKTAPELITRQSSIDNQSLVENLLDPDRVLEKLGIDPDVAFQDTTTDDHLTSVMGTRQASVKGMNWNLTVGKSTDRILKACQDMLEGINRNHQGMGIDRAIDDILQANPWGMSALEPIWQTGPNEWVPVELKGRPFRYFTFNNANEIRFLAAGASYDGIALPPKSLILNRHWITSNSFDNPYGDKLLSKSYWPVFFKRNGVQWYNIMLEKFGMPWVHGKVENGVSETVKDTFADSLANTIQDAILVSSKAQEVELIEIGSKGDAGKVYTDMLHYMDSALSKIWLGETLTTEIGDVGSYAASKTHAGVKDERRDQDKKMVISGFQTLIDWFVELNFGVGVPSPNFEMISPLGVNTELATRDKTLKETGVKFTKIYYERKYGLEDDEFDLSVDQETPPPEGQFAKAKVPNDQKQVDNIKDELDPAELQKQANGMLKPVLKLIADSSDYKELMKVLLSIYPEMNSEELEAELLKAYNLSDTIGRLENANS